MCFSEDYLDISCAVLLSLYEILKSPNDRIEEKKLKVLMIRTAMGLLINVCGFLVVCGINRTGYRESGLSVTMFSIILLYNVFFYGVMTFALLKGFSSISTREDWFRYFKSFITVYRIMDIIFDILLFVYNLFADRWRFQFTTNLMIPVIVFDIVLNLISFGIYFRKSRNQNHNA